MCNDAIWAAMDVETAHMWRTRHLSEIALLREGPRRELSAEEAVGRQSGAVEWRVSRGEVCSTKKENSDSG